MEGKLARREKSPHLMCGKPFWGIVGAIGSASLCYVSYSRLQESDFSWSHDWQSIATAAVWILLVVGLLSETRCWRERAFFGLLLLNFVSWLTLSVWTTAPYSAVRDVRRVTVGLWGLAALTSLATTFGLRPSDQERREEQGHNV